MAEAVSGQVLLTVWCALCKAEKRPKPCQLGHVERATLDGQPIVGATVWIPRAMSTRRAFRPGLREARWLRKVAVVVSLTDPRRSQYRAPDQLGAWCPHHGLGTVSTADVIDRRGRVTLNLSATAP